MASFEHEEIYRGHVVKNSKFKIHATKGLPPATKVAGGSQFEVARTITVLLLTSGFLLAPMLRSTHAPLPTPLEANTCAV